MVGRLSGLSPVLGGNNRKNIPKNKQQKNVGGSLSMLNAVKGIEKRAAAGSASSPIRSIQNS